MRQWYFLDFGLHYFKIVRMEKRTKLILFGTLLPPVLFFYLAHDPFLDLNSPSHAIYTKHSHHCKKIQSIDECENTFLCETGTAPTDTWGEESLFECKAQNRIKNTYSFYKNWRYDLAQEIQEGLISVGVPRKAVRIFEG